MNTTLEEQETGVRSYRWTRDEYYRMAELGLLQPDSRTELIDGEIIQKVSPIGRSHRVAVYRIAETLRAIFRDGYYVDQDIPVVLTDNTEPEPDIVVAVGQVTDYDPHPRPSDIRLLVEVSDATLMTDRNRKARTYAKAQIAEYWIVNLIAMQLEIHRDPTPSGAYRNVTAYTIAKFVSPLAMPDAAISVADLFPPSEL